VRFLPLSLTAHPTAWGLDPAGMERQAPVRVVDAPCRFCGAFATGRQEAFHLDGDHTNNHPKNLVPACTLCHLVQHPDVAARQRSVMLVWLPEMSQAAVFMLARTAQLDLVDAKADPTLDEPPARSSDVVDAAWSALSALRAREEQARSRLLTDNPNVLGAALLALTPRAFRGRSNLLSGIRMLPTGRMLVDGKDIYPGLLRAWAGRPEPEPKPALVSTPKPSRKAA
jgi:hypothetical protein